MHCPFCGFEETIVKDSRIVDEGKSIRRRRFCSSCESRFTTYEKVHIKEVIVVKRSGEKEVFDRDKLMKAIKMSVRKRPINAIEIANITNSIINDLNDIPDIEVSSARIGELVLNYLKNIDMVAYVRFASVYKDFGDAEDFVKFIQDLA